jgi:hypothetical protein
MGYSFDYLDRQSFSTDSFVEIPIDNYSIYTELTCTQGKIYFKQDELSPIEISTIVNVKVNDRMISLMGEFKHQYRIVKKINITFYNKSLQDKFEALVGKRGISATGMFVLTNGEACRNFDVEIKRTNTYMEVMDSKSGKKFIQIEKDDLIFLDENTLLIFNGRGYPYYIIFEGETLPLDLTGFNLVDDRYYHSATRLSGSLGTLKFKDEEVGILLNEDDLHIFVDYYNVYSIEYSQLKVCFKHSNGHTIFHFTASNGEDSYVLFSKLPDKLESLLSRYESEGKDIVLVEGIPHRLTFEKGEWVFKGSLYNQFSLPLENIKSIHVRDNQNIENIVCIKIENPEAMELQIICHEDFIPVLVSTTFKEKKYPLLHSAKLTDLYSSWGRQLNDFMLYHLFGQLIILNKGIKEIQEKDNLSAQKKNEQILNFMYYAIREQKHTLERVAITFPQTVLEEERSFLFLNREADYEQFQAKLLAISNQVHRSLTEIESSLNPVSFAIIPRKSLEVHIEKKEKRSYWGAAILTGLGVVTGGIGLVAAGGILALNSYFGKKEKQEVHQYREENDQYKIEFHISKALDSFDHLMMTMLPYYVSQTSKAYYSVAKANSKLLAHQNGQEINKTKNAIFERLVNLHTAKQLPLEQGNLLNSEAVIKELSFSDTNNDYKLIGSISE